MSNERSMRRERALAEISSKPLMKDAVYHSAKFGPRNKQKEVCDILLLHRRQAIVISIKNQDVKRSKAKTEQWINKNGEHAIAQLRGACRTIRTSSFWCEHYSGRIEFGPGDMAPCHTVAVLDTDCEVVLKSVGYSQRDGLGAPLTIMSMNDFVYLIGYLRTFSDLSFYLQRRHTALAEQDWRRVGVEHYFFVYYTAHRDSFSGFVDLDQAKQVAVRGQHVAPGSAFRDQERILASAVEEFMSEAESATPDPVLALGRTEPPDEQRQLLTEMRVELSDLLVQERAYIGEQIAHLCQRAAQEGEGTFFGTVRSGRLPDMIVVCVVCRGKTEEKAWEDGMDILLAACAHFGKRTGLLLMLVEVGTKTVKKFGSVRNFEPDAEYLSVGREYFLENNPRRIGDLR